MPHLNTSRAWPLSGDVSLKKGTTRDKLALRRAPVPLALSATPPTKPPARVSAVVCFFRNFSRGFIPAGMVVGWVGVFKDGSEERLMGASYITCPPAPCPDEQVWAGMMDPPRLQTQKPTLTHL